MNPRIKLILFVLVMSLLTWFEIIPFFKRDSYEETIKKDCAYIFKSPLKHLVIKNEISIRYKNIPQVYFKDLKTDSVYFFMIFRHEIGERVKVGDTLIKHANSSSIYIHKKKGIDTVNFICK